MSRFGTLLLVDDSAYTRARFRRFIETECGVVGSLDILEASDGEEALARYKEFEPAVVVTDLIMRGLGGLEAAETLLADDPNVRIILLTVVSDNEVRRRALAAGIRHVVNKNDFEKFREALTEELNEAR